MTEKFVITGMTCAACAAHVERAAASVPGVHSASVNLMLGSLVCDHDDSTARRPSSPPCRTRATARLRRAPPGGISTQSRMPP